MINYTPFGHSDWQTIVSDIKAFGSAGKKTAVVSTINGDANVPFYKELGNQGISAEDPRKPTFTGKSSAASSMRWIFQGPGVQVVAFVPVAGPVPPPSIVVIPDMIASSIC